MQTIYWITFFDPEAVSELPVFQEWRWLLTDDLAKAKANYQRYGSETLWRCNVYTAGASAPRQLSGDEILKELEGPSSVSDGSTVAAAQTKVEEQGSKSAFEKKTGPMTAPRTCYFIQIKSGGLIEFFASEAELKAAVRQKEAERLRPKLAASIKQALTALGHVAQLALDDELVWPAAHAWNELGREMTANAIKAPIDAFIAPLDTSLKQTFQAFTSISFKSTSLLLLPSP